MKTPDQMDLKGLYRTFHPNAAEYTFFSSAHGSFSRTDHMLGHKTRLNTFKKTEIISSVFSDHSGMILEVNYKKDGKITDMLRLKNTLLNYWIDEEIKGEI